MLKQIKGFEDYSIDEFGNVYSHYTNKYLKLASNGKGYLFVCLGRGNRRYVHRLVAETFIPKTDEDIKLGRDYVDHIDGNKQNNHVNNLRWCTVKENVRFPLARKNQSKAQQKRYKNNIKLRETFENANKKRMKPVIINNIEYESMSEAARQLNVHIRTIYRRLNNPKFKNYQYIRELI